MLISKKGGNNFGDNIAIEIDSICQSIDNESYANTLYLNPINNVFAQFDSNYEIPQFSVHGIKITQTIEIVKWLSKVMPQYIVQHRYVKDPLMANDIYSLQFYKRVSGRIFDFVHILSVDLKFSGDSNNILQRGDVLNLPSYSTDRSYFHSFLVAVEKSTDEKNFQIIKTLGELDVESDEAFHTFAIFDEYNSRDKSIELCSSFDELKFSISPKIFPMLEYRFMTYSFNVIDPTTDNISKAVDIFEPIYAFSYLEKGFKVKGKSKEGIIQSLGGDLIDGKDGVKLSSKFIERANNYFEKITLITDDDLRLKDWKKIEIQN